MALHLSNGIKEFSRYRKICINIIYLETKYLACVLLLHNVGKIQFFHFL